MILTIGISYAPDDNPKYGNYKRALLRAAEAGNYDIEVVSLYDSPGRVEEIDGIVFTGGVDIAPSRYGKAEEESLCMDIDESRDMIEFGLAKRTEEREIPTMGICRGAQLLNVYHGGTLVTDIQHFGGHDHKRLDPNTDNRHRVKVEPGTLTYKLLRSLEGEVNSAHHQAVEQLGAGLSAAAFDETDGTIEAIEWADPTGKPFFIAVQWHPERMDPMAPFAGTLFESFIWEVAAHKLLKARMARPKSIESNTENE